MNRKLTLAEILRASHVKRWNIVATTRDQSVAEHMYNVCMIARAVCKTLNMNDVAITKAALEHDLDEVIYGDIPSPVKAKLSLNGINLNDYLTKSMRKLNDKEKFVLKYADLRDAELFLRDHKIGEHAHEVYIEILAKLNLHNQKGQQTNIISVAEYYAIQDEEARL